MVMEFIDGLQVIYIKDSTRKIKDMEQVKCSGMMEVIIMDNGQMVYNMDMEN